jgi:hypothetical protein
MRKAAGDCFDVVRAICNGAKHLQTDATHPIAFRAGEDPGEDRDRPPAFLGEMVLGISVLGDVAGGRDIGKGRARFDLYSACKITYLAFCSSFPKHLGQCSTSGL